MGARVLDIIYRKHPNSNIKINNFDSEIDHIHLGFSKKSTYIKLKPNSKYNSDIVNSKVNTEVALERGSKAYELGVSFKSAKVGRFYRRTR